jgi:hypothetical protein
LRPGLPLCSAGSQSLYQLSYPGSALLSFSTEKQTYVCVLWRATFSVGDGCITFSKHLCPLNLPHKVNTNNLWNEGIQHLQELYTRARTSQLWRMKGVNVPETA